MLKPAASDDEMPAEMLSSWIIIDKTVGQTSASKYLVMTDLQKLCQAANTCTHSIHIQLDRLFRNCRIPLTPYEKAELALFTDVSPINILLQTLQLIDPQDDTTLIEDYTAHACSATDDQLKSMSPPETHVVVVETAKEDTQTPATTDSLESSAYTFFKSAMAYPLAPFASVIAYMKSRSQALDTQKADVQTEATEHVMPHETDPALENHAKYEKALTHGKKLLKGVSFPHKETHLLLAQLQEQLTILQKGITANIQTIELDRSSFSNLQQCVVPKEMSLSDMLLLQYSKMRQYGASIDTVMHDFFNIEGRKLTDISQEEFELRWNEIQERNRTGQLSPDAFSKLRQYSYILQNPTARFMAQAFLDGSINAYGMTDRVAQERGLTQKRIGELNTELSNCKDFLLQLNKAFTDSRKNIETAMKE